MNYFRFLNKSLSIRFLATKVKSNDRLKIGRFFELQWEKSQERYVLLYPEGMVTFNEVAGDILKLCDGNNEVSDIKKSLEEQHLYLEGFESFLEEALQKNWIEIYNSDKQ